MPNGGMIVSNEGDVVFDTSSNTSWLDGSGLYPMPDEFDFAHRLDPGQLTNLTEFTYPTPLEDSLIPASNKFFSGNQWHFNVYDTANDTHTDAPGRGLPSTTRVQERSVSESVDIPFAPANDTAGTSGHISLPSASAISAPAIGEGDAEEGIEKDKSGEEELDESIRAGTSLAQRNPDRPVLPIRQREKAPKPSEEEKLVQKEKAEDRGRANEALGEAVVAAGVRYAEDIAAIAAAHFTTEKRVRALLGAPHMIRRTKAKINIGNTIFSEFSKQMNAGELVRSKVLQFLN